MRRPLTTRNLPLAVCFDKPSPPRARLPSLQLLIPHFPCVLPCPADLKQFISSRGATLEGAIEKRDLVAIAKALRS